MIALSDRPVSRQHLAQLLFCDADDPLGALRWTLAELRRAVGTPGAFLGDPVGFDPREIILDAGVLERGGTEAVRIAERAGPLLEGGDVSGCPEFETWLVVARHRLRSRADGYLRATAMRALAIGDASEAVRLAGVAVTASPYDEKLQELLVRSLARAGEGQAAAGQARRAADLLDLAVPTEALLDAAGDTQHPSVPSAPDAVVLSLLEAGVSAVGPGAADAGIAMLRGCADRAGSRDVKGRALLALGTALVHSVRGKDEEGAVVLHEALLLAREVDDRRTTVNALRELAFVDVQAGRTATVSVRLAEALALAGDEDDLTAGVLGIVGMHRSDRGDPAGSLEALAESVRRAEHAGQPRQVAWSEGLMARSLLLLDEPARAISAADRSIAGCRGERWQAFLPFPMAMRAESQLAEGATSLDGVEDDLRAAFALGCQLGDPCSEGAAARGLALVQTRHGDPVRARTTIEDAYRRTVRHPDSYVFIEAWVLAAGIAVKEALSEDSSAAVSRLRSWPGGPSSPGSSPTPASSRPHTLDLTWYDVERWLGLDRGRGELQVGDRRAVDVDQDLLTGGEVEQGQRARRDRWWQRVTASRRRIRACDGTCAPGCVLTSSRELDRSRSAAAPRAAWWCSGQAARIGLAPTRRPAVPA